MIIYTAVSEKGINKSFNEHFVMLPPNDDNLCNELGFLFILSEGLGNYENGKLASKKISVSIRDSFYFQLQPNKNILQDLQDFIEDANDKLISFKNDNKMYHEISATTCTSLFIDNNLYVASVGDNKMYCLQNGNLKQLTKSHISKNNVITSTLGLNTNFEIFLAKFNLQTSGTYLMCTNSVSNLINDDTLKNILNNNDSIKTKAETLYNNCIKDDDFADFSFVLIQINN